MRLCKCIFIISIVATSRVFSYEPSAHVDKNTFIYFEVSAADISIRKVKKLFYSLMPPKKADSEWHAFEELFLEDYGINFLSIDDIKDHGFDTQSSIGIIMNYFPVKIKDQMIYKKYYCTLLPSVNPVQSYEFFKDWFQGEKNTEQKSDQNKSRVTEFEKGRLFGIISKSKDPENIYFLRTKDAILISDNLPYLIKLDNLSGSTLYQDADFQTVRTHYKKKENPLDSIGYFFINSKISDKTPRDNPKLLFDNILLDNVFIKELSANSNYISGEIKMNDRTFKINIDYFFPPDYLSKRDSILGDTLNFKNGIFFPDQIASTPFMFFKMQSNFSSSVARIQNKGVVSRKNIESFFQKLTNGFTAELPENIELLAKDNISFYIREIPTFREISKLYKWKYYISMNYNSEYFDSFRVFMKNLEKKSLEKKGIKIEANEISGKYFWKLIVTDYSKKFDKKINQVVLEEHNYNVFILADSSQIIITDDEKINISKPAFRISPLFISLDTEFSEKKEILFSYFDMKKLLVYLEQNSFAFSLKNYLGYFQNAESAIFKVTQDQNIINKEFILKVAR